MPSLPIGPLELLLILAIALLVLGPGKLPEVGSAMGKTIREFRKASTDIQDATDVSSGSPARTVRTAAAPGAVSSDDGDPVDDDVAPRGTPVDPKGAAS